MNLLKKIFFRFFKILGKTLLLLLMFIYISNGYAAAKLAYKRFYYRREDISMIETRLTEKAPAAEIVDWIKARPLAETDEIIRRTEAHAGQLPPFAFDEFYARAVRREKPEDALFWYHLAAFRLRIDMLRCLFPPDAVSDIESMRGEMPAMLADYITEHPEAQDAALRRVLDYDKKNPATYDVKPFCSQFLRADSPDYWTNFRAGMRRNLQNDLDSRNK